LAGPLAGELEATILTYTRAAELDRPATGWPLFFPAQKIAGVAASMTRTIHSGKV